MIGSGTSLRADFRRDLAFEFLSNPFGDHSPGLRRILDIMRYQDLPGKFVLVRSDDGSLLLAALPGHRGGPVRFTDASFRSAADAERHVFRLRWKHLTGEDLE